jgi:hypothetical protein
MAQADGPREPQLRPAAKAISILLPVWGAEFVNQFLDHSLPTLLAPGNIPALAQALPTRFVFLTRARDEAVIRAHPACRHLSQLCEVGFSSIDDLIAPGNHSTTITLAFAREVREAGPIMLDTCFFFLVADYIMADGSLAAVWARMQRGASAVQVGNFQVDEETAEAWLHERLAGAGTSLALTPREVMRWALGCMHPLTAANIVNFPLCHNAEANRLLWRVDADTLIGRFYLLHMICIRPEVTDFFVGASCDYSFVPEMCPSANVVTIADSDDYLVVEVQPAGHESQFLRFGPGSVDTLAKSLSEWTTAGHRANARQTIVFHASELPATLPVAIAEADSFVGKLAARLARHPQPHRDHPYWLGAIAAFNATVARRGALGSGEVSGSGSRSALIRAVSWARGKLLGRMPEVRRAHPRWGDVRLPVAACKTLIAEAQPRLLIGANRATALTEWVRNRAPGAVHPPLRRLRRQQPVAGLEPGSFDASFIELVDDDIAQLDEILDAIVPLLRPGGQIVLVAINSVWFAGAGHFGRIFATNAPSLVYSRLWPDEVRIGSVSRFRWWVNGACLAMVAGLSRCPALLVPLRLAAAAVLVPLALSLNLVSSWRADRPVRGRIISSVFMRFHTGPATTANGADRRRTDHTVRTGSR